MKRIELTRFAPLDYAGAEALNTLCTNLSFCGSSVKKIMITSCHAAEGKSYLTMNLMRKMAELGKKVIMVDADLRRSRIGSKYGMRVVEGRALGLTHYLAGMCGVDEVVYATNIPGAYMVPVGHEVSNSLALLTHEHFKRLLDELAREYDLVLVDAPPVASSSMRPKLRNPATGCCWPWGITAPPGASSLTRKNKLSARAVPYWAWCSTTSSWTA